ncbi:uncharacterized protein RAG0_03098 [Rhynchosporium agropyri]|uniref:Uncharacterized protein n=1 Tax=Rhynchosporium agropyri TaxID=914238 RepID=A0A1E1K2Y8_9HELO|nr:uncharacterized protein RAG0_03098 [Rhynchosporium agropyri]
MCLFTPILSSNFFSRDYSCNSLQINKTPITILTFDERRDTIKADTQLQIKVVNNTKRQALYRARTTTKKQKGFKDLPVEEKESLQNEAEARVLAKRAKASKKYNNLVTRYLDIENKQLELVLKEEKAIVTFLVLTAIRKKALGVRNRQKRKARELKEDDNNNNKFASSIRGSFKKNLEPLIKRLEVKIIKEGSKKNGVKKEEIDTFIKDITNPKAIEEFYARDKEIEVKEDNYNSDNILVEVSTNKEEEDNKEEFSK